MHTHFSKQPGNEASHCYSSCDPNAAKIGVAYCTRSHSDSYLPTGFMITVAQHVPRAIVTNHGTM